MTTLIYRMALPKKEKIIEIYEEGRIYLEVVATQRGVISIPNVIEKFFRVKKKGFQETIQLTCFLGMKSKKQVKQILCAIDIQNTYQIRPIKEEEKELIAGKKVKVRINGITKQYQTGYFRALVKLRNENQPELISNLRPLVTGGDKNTEFTLYENNRKQLFIHCKVSKCGSKILLSDELTRYIENWHAQGTEHFVCTVNEDFTMVVKAESRKGNREGRFFKELFFYSHDIPEESTITLTAQHLKLSEQAKADLALVKELQQRDFQIKQLTSDWLPNSEHRDNSFARDVWTILERAFADEQVKILHEPKITCDSPQKQVKCIDGLVVWNELLGLVEVKTSKKLKNSYLDEVIGELLFLQEQIAKSGIFTLLFINSEVMTSTSGKQITKLYGLTNNIILIGKKEVESLLAGPTLLLERIRKFLKKQAQKRRHNQLLHPTSMNVTTVEQIEEEAYGLLKELITNPRKANEIINQYCFLINISKTDFLTLYDKLFQEHEQGRIDPSQQLRPSKRFFDWKVLESIHQELITNNNYTILLEKSYEEANKNDYEVLLQNWSTITKALPPMIRAVQLGKLQPSTGVFFESTIRKHLESTGAQVISNVLLSQYGKHFEVDLLAIKDEHIEIISCKDRSSFQYTPNLYSKISFAFGWLFLRRKSLKNVHGKLFIRVKPSILSTVQKRFESFHSQETSLILVR